MGKSTISMAIFNSYVMLVKPEVLLVGDCTHQLVILGNLEFTVFLRVPEAGLGEASGLFSSVFGMKSRIFDQLVWAWLKPADDMICKYESSWDVIIIDHQPSLTASFTRITPLATWKNIATAQVAIGISLWLLCGLDAATRFDPYGILRTTIWQRLNILSTLAPSIQLGW